ncbi:membrane protein [Spatholobus suberectus]|nr:membrane protein [Spatholobus suberectus]
MLSVLGCPSACAKFVSDGLISPFHCLHLTNTDNSLKLGCTPSQRNCSKSFCQRKEHITPFSQGFSALQEDDSPWECGKALSLLTIQILELSGALVLLKYTAKPHYKLSNFFKKNKLLSNRNWFLSSALGFGFLVLLIFLTSLLADRLFGSKPVNNPILKDMLLNSDISRVSCVLAYCIVTPLLEEIVYRGFLLTSLSCTREWQQAVTISSVIFSAIHFSGENFVQLFIIGCVLGCSYCWTGNLNSAIAIHSLYNALTVVITYFY